MTITAGAASGAYSAARNLIQAGAASGAAGGASLLGGASSSGASGQFGDLLRNVMEGVGESGRKADAAAMSAAAGKADLVNVVTAVAESETALQTLVAVRDRVISAYEEIMRMQI